MHAGRTVLHTRVTGARPVPRDRRPRPARQGWRIACCLLDGQMTHDLVTIALAGTIVLAAIGGSALAILVARYGVTGTQGSAVVARQYFFARLTYFTVGASLALTGVLAAVGLSASVRSASGATPPVTIAESPAELEALRARIRGLEATLSELELRIARVPARAEAFGTADARR